MASTQDYSTDPSLGDDTTGGKTSLLGKLKNKTKDKTSRLKTKLKPGASSDSPSVGGDSGFDSDENEDDWPIGNAVKGDTAGGAVEKTFGGTAHDAQNLETNSKNFGGEVMSSTTESLVARPVDISSSGDDESTESAQSEEVQSEEEIAAVRVQAGYRGYVVRRSRPSEQLRTIANVEARLKELKEQVSDAAFRDEVRKEGSMARVTFMESTMALLLQLDGIQGVPPDVRSDRKAVSREIIALQDSQQPR